MMRVGVLGYGGGPSVIPLFRHEVVTRLAWMDDAAFAETLALGYALPGPIATKMAAYVGHRAAGGVGAVVAVTAHILPTCLATVALLSVFGSLEHLRVVRDMIAAVVPVVVAMLARMTFDFAVRTKRSLGWKNGALSMVVACGLLAAQVNSALVILLYLGFGAARSHIQRAFAALRANGGRRS